MNCYVSTLKTFGLVCLAILMTAASYFAATHASGGRVWICWLGVPFFGVGGAILARRLFVKSPLVTIDAQGLSSARLGPHPIAWREIEAVSIGTVRATRFLCVWLKDEESYLRTLSMTRSALARANEAMGFPAVAISFQGLTPGLDEAYARVRMYVPEKGGRS